VTGAPFPRWRQVVLDTTDARGLAEFYRQLLGFGYRLGDEPPGPGADDEHEPLRVYADPSGHLFCLFVTPERQGLFLAKRKHAMRVHILRDHVPGRRGM
jgi:hypothetical protein